MTNYKIMYRFSVQYSAKLDIFMNEFHCVLLLYMKQRYELKTFSHTFIGVTN